ncbi:MAG: hypothetical protein KDK63_02995 [Chlamydiia bacterium]|nr:hypothetical protein [Chlamydiia bacterium]
MKKTWLALFIGVSAAGFAVPATSFELCDKTYVDPFCVDLHENIIEVESSGELIQTSAIYSDEYGLYYKDYLKEKGKESSIDTASLFSDDFFSNHHELNDPLTQLEEEEEIVIAQEEPPAQAPPKIQRGWPYIN